MKTKPDALTATARRCAQIAAEVAAEQDERLLPGACQKAGALMVASRIIREFGLPAELASAGRGTPGGPEAAE